MEAADSYLERGRAFHSLSVKDLLEARDAYHVFLIRKKNVIGSAIGKYRIRKKDVPRNAPKTLENTEVRGYSWPCVIVFVKDWIDDASFGKKGAASYDDYLPQQLYLPDGREIPVCVITAAWQLGPAGVPAPMRYPGSVVGGGYPVMTKVQGEDRWATLACLVSDGRMTYALTNSHVAGRSGSSLFTLRNGNEEEIGVSAGKLLHKVSFSSVYAGFPGRHAFVNLDIGLVELRDLRCVTSQVYGIGDLKGIADVNHDTLSLKLVGCPVLGFGCASGEMRGEIFGLFYRYAGRGGFDYVADYLVGSRGGASRMPFDPRHGDSGTLLVIDDPRSDDHMKALAVLWGGQKDETGEKVQPYGLATNLGTICRLLDVELVCNWNTVYDQYFGAYAHVVLPSLCAGIVGNRALRELMVNNADSFSLPLENTAVKATKGLSNRAFVPLSDVPDLVWKKRGGAYQRSREGSNHFADMDQPNPADGGRTLLDLCEDPANIDPDAWLGFYRAVKAREKGALPFRIAQVYDEMVRAAEGGAVERFVCAAGILTHYVFDACMPLHISHMHHGDPNGPMKTVTKAGKEKEIPLAYEVHDEFDNQMVEYHVDALRQALPGLVKDAAAAPVAAAATSLATARDVACAAVALMRSTVEKHVNPEKIVRDFEELVELSPRERCRTLWEKYGDGYLQAMAEAVVLVARIWEAAWVNGNGEKNITSTDAVPAEALRELYETKKGFLDSVKLEDIKGAMRWGAG